MKFNCGPTKEQLEEARERAEREWHSVFAWWPVRMGSHMDDTPSNDCRWLEVIERRRPRQVVMATSPGAYTVYYSGWEYRSKE